MPWLGCPGPDGSSDLAVMCCTSAREIADHSRGDHDRQAACSQTQGLTYSHCWRYKSIQELSPFFTVIRLDVLRHAVQARHMPQKFVPKVAFAPSRFGN